MTDIAGLAALVRAGAVDFGRRSEDYSRHRPGPPSSLYSRLEKLLTECQLGKSRNLVVVDLGCGTGVFGRELLKRGIASHCTFVDISDEQMAQAKSSIREDFNDDDALVDLRAAFVVGSAGELSSIPTATVDLVSASTAWPWFPQPDTLGEVARVLKHESGAVFLTQLCWCPADRVAKATEDLVLRYSPSWPMAGFNGLFASQVEQLEAFQFGSDDTSSSAENKGAMEDARVFALTECFAYDYQQPFTHDSWRGRQRTCNAIGSGSLTADQVASFDADLQKILRDSLTLPEHFTVRHRVWGVLAMRTSMRPNTL